MIGRPGKWDRFYLASMAGLWAEYTFASLYRQEWNWLAFNLAVTAVWTWMAYLTLRKHVWL